MARLPNLRCHCGAFEMIDSDHTIEHGRPGQRAKHTAEACDPDPMLTKPCAVCSTPRGSKAAAPGAPHCLACGAPIIHGTEAPRVFRIGVQK